MTNQFTLKDVINITKFTLVWSILNAILNLFGLWLSKLINEAEYTYLANIMTEFVKPLLIQTLIFIICYAIAFQFLKNKNLAKYSFLIVQTLIFHIIFFLNIEYDNGFFFTSTFRNPGLVYLGVNGQYLIDILYQFIPIAGNFEYGQFIPFNNAMFYLQWVFLVLLYFFGLTWITKPVERFFFENNNNVSVPEKVQQLESEIDESELKKENKLDVVENEEIVNIETTEIK